MNFGFRLVLTFFVLILFTTPATAQIDRFSCAGKAPLTEAEGLAAIKEAQEWYRNHSMLQGEFSQYSYLASMDIAESSGGKVWVTNTGLMRWSYSEPEEQEFLIREDTLWYYKPADQQLVIDRFQSLLISDLPVAFLMGLGDLSKDFRFDSGCLVEGERRLHLSPANAATANGNGSGRSELSRFVLAVSTSGQPAGAQVEDISGSLNAIELTDITVSDTVTAQVFEPSFPDGIDIVDGRLNGATGK